ncbi:MAG TPA: ester cyclase [Rubrobacteraceae bacterium]|nr:ester cyclase [Rubrobacteraceae bacterium]
MSEENKDLARRSWEMLVNEQNPDSIDELYTPDFVWHEPDQDIQGFEEARQFLSTYLTAFPDMRVSVEEAIAEGDKVVTRWTIRGTHQGELEEFGPPTGKQIEIKGITIHRIEDGKIAEEWERYDNLSIMQQLGLVPDQQ